MITTVHYFTALGAGTPITFPTCYPIQNRLYTLWIYQETDGSLPYPITPVFVTPTLTWALEKEVTGSCGRLSLFSTVSTLATGTAVVIKVDPTAAVGWTCGSLLGWYTTETLVVRQTAGGYVSQTPGQLTVSLGAVSAGSAIGCVSGSLFWKDHAGGETYLGDGLTPPAYRRGEYPATFPALANYYLTCAIDASGAYSLTRDVFSLGPTAMSLSIIAEIGIPPTPVTTSIGRWYRP